MEIRRKIELTRYARNADWILTAANSRRRSLVPEVVPPETEAEAEETGLVVPPTLVSLTTSAAAWAAARAASATAAVAAATAMACLLASNDSINGEGSSEDQVVPAGVLSLLSKNLVVWVQLELEFEFEEGSSFFLSLAVTGDEGFLEPRSERSHLVALPIKNHI